MKNLLSGLILLLIPINTLSQTESSNAELQLFFKSLEFRNVTTTFKFSITDVDQQNYAFEKSADDKTHFFRLLVKIDGKPNFLSVFSVNKGQIFAVVFEKNALNSTQTNGYFEHYSDLGGFYADFAVTKIGSLYKFTLNDVDVSKRFHSTNAGKKNCVVRTYAILKAACESDPTCDFMCDMLPSCHHSMALAAIGHCMGL